MTQYYWKDAFVMGALEVSLLTTWPIKLSKGILSVYGLCFVLSLLAVGSALVCFARSYASDKPTRAKTWDFLVCSRLILILISQIDISIIAGAMCLCTSVRLFTVYFRGARAGYISLTSLVGDMLILSQVCIFALCLVRGRMWALVPIPVLCFCLHKDSSMRAVVCSMAWFAAFCFT